MYSHQDDGGEELYDHSKDEMEWNNLANDPAYAMVKEQMKKWIHPSDAWLEKSGFLQLKLIYIFVYLQKTIFVIVNNITH